MLVGLLSDTHGSLDPRVFDHFREVELILHAGDIGPPSILVELEAVAPVTAVWGNTDGFDIRRTTVEVARIEVAGRQLVLLHGHQLGSPTPEALRAAHSGADIIIYGHTHRPLVDRQHHPLVVNPGSAGAPRFGLGPSVALLELDGNGEQVRVIEF
jgi:uncharacterized protein